MENCLIRGDQFVSDDFALIGRFEELQDVYSVLMRQKASSLILFGESGSGCSSMLKGVQSSKSSHLTPFDIVAKTFYWLDVDALFSSDTSSIFDIFDRMNSTLSRSKNNVLIIDNAKGFIEGARSSGADNIISKIISSIKAKKYQVIFESHDQDLPLILKMHSNILDLFTIKEIKEPKQDVLIDIVRSASIGIYNHHFIKVSDEAILTAVDLTTKYRANNLNLGKAQPQASIDLLDLAMSEYRCNSHKNINSDDSDKLASIFSSKENDEDYLLDLQSQLEDEVAKNQSIADEGEKAYKTSQSEHELRENIRNVIKSIDESQKQYADLAKSINSGLELNSTHVLDEFSLKSGIPMDKLTENEQEKLLSLAAGMKETVFSQDEAVDAVCNAVKVSSVGLGDEKRPRGVFMLPGSSGVGKTYLSKRLSYGLNGSEDSMIRFDMSEYMEKHAVAKLIGAPAGYEGYEHGGILTNKVRKNPHSIVLLDEIEKADVSVFDVFLQVFDDGRLTDNRGITVDFSDTLIIMTTNIGQEHYLNENLTHEQAHQLAMDDLSNYFRPEFLNRIGGRANIISCKILDVDTIVKIAKVEIHKANKKLASKTNITLKMSDKDVQALCEQRYDASRGARSIDGVFGAQIYPFIADVVLSGSSDGVITIKYDRKKDKISLISS